MTINRITEHKYKFSTENVHVSEIKHFTGKILSKKRIYIYAYILLINTENY